MSFDLFLKSDSEDFTTNVCPDGHLNFDSGGLLYSVLWVGSVDHVTAERYIPIIPAHNIGPVSLSNDNDLTICFVKPGCQGQKLPKEKM